MTGSKPDRRLRDGHPIKTRMTTTIIRPAPFNESQAVSTTLCLEALDEQARRLRLPSAAVRLRRRPTGPPWRSSRWNLAKWVDAASHDSRGYLGVNARLVSCAQDPVVSRLRIGVRQPRIE